MEMKPAVSGVAVKPNKSYPADTSYQQDPNIIQSKILVAQKIPRDRQLIISDLKGLFEIAFVRKMYAKNNMIFSIPRKNKKTGEVVNITGLSITAVTELARLYKHLDYGITAQPSLDKKTTIVHTWCHDLQNNTTETRNFTVYIPPYIQNSRNFSDDHYKFCYSEAMRRMRSCIERTLPQWLVDSFRMKIEQVKKLSYKKVGLQEALTDMINKWIFEYPNLQYHMIREKFDLDNKELTEELILELDQRLTAVKTGEIRFVDLFPNVSTVPEPEAKVIDERQKTKNFLEELRKRKAIENKENE